MPEHNKTKLKHNSKERDMRGNNKQEWIHIIGYAQSYVPIAKTLDTFVNVMSDISLMLHSKSIFALLLYVEHCLMEKLFSKHHKQIYKVTQPKHGCQIKTKKFSSLKQVRAFIPTANNNNNNTSSILYKNYYLVLPI